MRTRWITLLAIASFTILATWTAVAGDFQTMSRAQSNRMSAAALEPARLPRGIAEGITANGTYTLYLPLVVKEESPPPLPPSISGTVTFQGEAISNTVLALRFWNGSQWNTDATTTTNTSGAYRFLITRTLTSGQRYYVRYSNLIDNKYLSYWYTHSITESPTTEIWFEDFDIANVVLNYPTHPHTGPLPIPFQWTRRNATPTDDYFLDLFDPADYNPRIDQRLQGYVSSYTLNSLPTGFQNGVQYGWNVGIRNLAGGTGYSYYYHAITFTSTGFAPTNRLILANLLHPTATTSKAKSPMPSNVFHPLDNAFVIR